MIIDLLPSKAVLPATGNAELVQVDGTNLSWKELRYDDTVVETAFWEFTIPDNYDGGDVDVHTSWKAAAVVGDVLFSLLHRALSDDSVWDAAGAQVDFAADTAKGTTEHLNEVTKTLTTPWSPGQRIQLELRRKPGDVADTMSGDAKALGVAIEFGVA